MRTALQRGGKRTQIFFCKNLFTASATEAAEKQDTTCERPTKVSPRTHGVVHGDPGEEPVQLRVKIMEISFHGMPCQHIAETRHHDFGDKCWGISSISQIDDRCEYTTLLPFKGHVPV